MPRSDSDRNLPRTVTGMKSYLEKRSVASGEVNLTEATVHWWILKDEDASEIRGLETCTLGLGLGFGFSMHFNECAETCTINIGDPLKTTVFVAPVDGRFSTVSRNPLLFSPSTRRPRSARR